MKADIRICTAAIDPQEKILMFKFRYMATDTTELTKTVHYAISNLFHM